MAIYIAIRSTVLVGEDRDLGAVLAGGQRASDLLEEMTPRIQAVCRTQDSGVVSAFSYKMVHHSFDFQGCFCEIAWVLY